MRVLARREQLELVDPDRGVAELVAAPVRERGFVVDGRRVALDALADRAQQGLVLGDPDAADATGDVATADDRPARRHALEREEPRAAGDEPERHEVADHAAAPEQRGRAADLGRTAIGERWHQLQIRIFGASRVGPHTGHRGTLATSWKLASRRSRSTV